MACEAIKQRIESLRLFSRIPDPSPPAADLPWEPQQSSVKLPVEKIFRRFFQRSFWEFCPIAPPPPQSGKALDLPLDRDCTEKIEPQNLSGSLSFNQVNYIFWKTIMESYILLSFPFATVVLGDILNTLQWGPFPEKRHWYPWTILTKAPFFAAYSFNCVLRKCLSLDPITLASESLFWGIVF